MIKVTTFGKNCVGQYQIRGIPKRLETRMTELGWTWARGVGCEDGFYTEDRAAAERMAEALGLIGVPDLPR